MAEKLLADKFISPLFSQTDEWSYSKFPAKMDKGAFNVHTSVITCQTIVYIAPLWGRSFVALIDH